MHSNLGPFTVYYNNSQEFHELKQEVFTRDTYYFEPEIDSPLIIDAGAHIGLSTLYFKRLFPSAHIIAIEPNPQSFALLKKNVFENQLSNVELHSVALDDNSGQREFYRDSTSAEWYSTAGFLPGAWNHQQKSESFLVKTRPLSDFLSKSVDLLKLDIEGAEQAVLTKAQERLTCISHLFVEFHPHSGQSLIKTLELLEPYFSLTVWKDGKEIKPKQARGLVLIEGHHH